MARYRGGHTCEELIVDGVDVRILRKRMKRMRMRVAPSDGHVEISMPFGKPTEEAVRFVHEKRSWIARQQRTLANSAAAKAELASEAEKRAWKEAVADRTPVLVERWAPVLGVAPGKLAYRNMRSRGGSCQPSTGRICINTRLALYPPECLEYVVVHELCHLREGGHTPRFWALVESCLPDYKRIKKLLR